MQRAEDQQKKKKNDGESDIGCQAIIIIWCRYNNEGRRSTDLITNKNYQEKNAYH